MTLIRGTTGNDRLTGSDGKARIIGDLGDDWIAGGDGNDRLTGDTGDPNDLSVCSQTGRAESVLTGCYFEVNEG